MDNKDVCKIMKALSNENRLNIYLEIAKNEKMDYKACECFIHDLMEKFNIGAPTISHHLKELSNAGLITTERKGKFLTATINKGLLNETLKKLSL